MKKSPATPRPAGPLPELLAPAGSPEALRAAVAAGADAVYLSGKRFGARKFAANFSDEEIEEGIAYAHARGVRVYVTVNTLVHDRELEDAGDYLVRLYAMGADAVLVQDAGIASLAREIVPGLPLHASTQMTIHNADGVRWAAGRGFSRVVLARELTLPEVKKIHEATRDTGVGLEIFTHGALCYSYSGACLLSSVIGGRSGNRGMCAQPCRKPYTLVCGDTDEYGRPANLREIRSPDRYILSPKDLCTYERLSELCGPVSSLKIEGRMKSPQYVATVVSSYRHALDAIAAGTFSPDKKTLADLALSFSRGFTKGYLLGDRHDTLMAREAPDNRGLEIGTVIRSGRDGTATIRLTAGYRPAPGDGITFLAGPGEKSWGFALNTQPVTEKDGIRIPVPRPVPAGTRVAVTFSRELENRSNRIIADPPAGLLRTLPLDLAVTVDADGSIAVQGTVAVPKKAPVPFSHRPELHLEPARSRPLTREAFARQLAKTGGSPFSVRNLAIDYAGDRFAPVAAINQVRRELLAAAAAALATASRPTAEDVADAEQRWKSIRKTYAVPDAASIPAPKTGMLCLVVYADSIESVRAAAGAGAGQVCFEAGPALPSHLCSSPVSAEDVAAQVSEAMEICESTGIRFAWKFPRITREGELALLPGILPGLAKSGLAACMAGDPGTADAIRRTVPGIELLAGPEIPVFNHAAVRALGEQFRLLTLSSELSYNEIAVLSALAARAGASPTLALVIQGAAEAMITDDCIPRLVPGTCPRSGRKNATPAPAFTGIRDETGRIFPVRADGCCRTHVGNSAELCLLDRLPIIRSAGIGAVVIDCRGKPPRYTAEMTRIYREAIDQTNAPAGSGSGDAVTARLMKEAKAISAGGITTGHFLRGLAG